MTMGLPWQPRGSDVMLPLQRAQVQSLVGELKSLVLHGVAKKKNYFNKHSYNNNLHVYLFSFS